MVVISLACSLSGRPSYEEHEGLDGPLLGDSIIHMEIANSAIKGVENFSQHYRVQGEKICRTYTPEWNLCISTYTLELEIWMKKEKVGNND